MAASFPPAGSADRAFRLVTVTAEPFGSYHLEPLRALTGVEVVHLLPYEHQRVDAPITVGFSLSALDSADLLLVAGGALSSWSAAVAASAAARRVPVVYGQFAHLSDAMTEQPCDGIFSAATAASEADAARISKHLRLRPDAVRVTGLPILDLFSGDHDPSGPLLLLLPYDLSRRDPAGLAARLAGEVRRSGGRVLVRPHPRDEPPAWASGMLAPPLPLPRLMASSSAVVAYPGTALLVAAAMGVPLLMLSAPFFAPVLSQAQRMLLAPFAWDGVSTPRPGLVPASSAAATLGPRSGTVAAAFACWSAAALRS